VTAVSDVPELATGHKWIQYKFLSINYLKHCISYRVFSNKIHRFCTAVRCCE